MAAAPSNFPSIVLSLFLLCNPASLPDYPNKRRLRPIDARDQNELPAISRDPNVIGAGCKASCAHRSLSSSWFRHSRPIGTQPITAPAIQATRGSQAFRAPGRRAATSGPIWQTSAPHAQSRYRRRPAPQATDSGHSITSYAKATPSGSFSAKPSFGSVFVGEDLEEIGSRTALLVST